MTLIALFSSLPFSTDGYTRQHRQQQQIHCKLSVRNKQNFNKIDSLSSFEKLSDRATMMMLMATTTLFALHVSLNRSSTLERKIINRHNCWNLDWMEMCKIRTTTCHTKKCERKTNTTNPKFVWHNYAGTHYEIRWHRIFLLTKFIQSRWCVRNCSPFYLLLFVQRKM